MENDRKVKEELKEFDDTKEGVKSLVDSGVAKIPRIFFCATEEDQKPFPASSNGSSPLRVPVVNLQGFESERRAEIVNEIRSALETWGFFQMVNHGVPVSAMKNLLESTREFHEQPHEMKIEFHSRDYARRVKYYSTGDLYQTQTAQWKDTLSCDLDDMGTLDLENLPLVCREAIVDYVNCMIGLKNVLSELVSEALGLESDYLSRMECLEIRRLLCHYYPPCPEPDLTLGIMTHSDPYFLTILLQDNDGGFQVFHQNQCLAVPPLDGSLLVNAGDFLQLITNDKFKSVEHRVIAGQVGPRTSVACLVYPNERSQLKRYGPLKELVSENNPPKYIETNYLEYVHYYGATGFDGDPTLPHFKRSEA